MLDPKLWNESITLLNCRLKFLKQGNKNNLSGLLFCQNSGNLPRLLVKPNDSLCRTLRPCLKCGNFSLFLWKWTHSCEIVTRFLRNSCVPNSPIGYNPAFVEPYAKCTFPQPKEKSSPHKSPYNAIYSDEVKEYNLPKYIKWLKIKREKRDTADTNSVAKSRLVSNTSNNNNGYIMLEDIRLLSNEAI